MSDGMIMLTPPEPPLKRSFDQDRELATALQETKNRFLQSFNELEDVSKACRMAEINHRQFVQWCNMDEDFAARYEDIQESINDRMESHIVSIADGDHEASPAVILQASAKYLEAHRPDKWGKRGGDGGGNVQVNIVIGQDPNRGKSIDVKAHGPQD